MDLLAGADLRLVPGGIVRRESETWLHLCPLSLPVERVEPVADEIVRDRDLDLCLHADRSLDVTVAVTESPAGDTLAARAAVDALEHLAAVATVDAIVDLVQPGETDWERLLS